MKKLIILLIVGTLGWHGYDKYQQRSIQSHASEPVSIDQPITHQAIASSNNFRCDGRTHCSQMTSCEEATWFLTNCPGMKMDGNNDGIPCERQWCK